MRAFLGELDRLTLAVVVGGALLGALWLASLPAAMILTGVLAPVGVILLLIGRRWLEAGLLPLVIGLVPTVAYRFTGGPELPVTLPETYVPPEIMAPGAAYLLLIIGVVTTAIVVFFEWRNSVRRERQEARHERRRDTRLGGRAP